ncbi:MAG: DUF4114 domain-containing protein, partial [Oculatellaceae cyanobacterium Prado106]|nr:DUF4114 domain-containing protein [Oculatellaceae cyanobacterium Prado106]
PAPDPDSFGFVSFLGLDVGLDGDLYVSDFANSVRRYDLTTGTLVDTLSTNYTNTTPSNNFVGSLAFGPEGDLYVAGFDVNTEIGAVLTFDGSSGSPTGPLTLLVPPNSRQRSIGLVLPPRVNISASENPAEINTQKGSFKIKLREADLVNGLVVNYRLGGTATPSDDYLLAAGGNITSLTADSFTIAPGATEAILEVLPVNDAVIDPNETVQLTLLSGSGYTIPGGSSSTLTIADNDGAALMVSDDNVLTIGGSNQNRVNVAFAIASVDTAFVNELGVFPVDDDQGSVNGLLPGQAGYLQAALGRSTVIASALAEPPNGLRTSDLSRLLQFSGNSRLVFYLVADSTVDAVLNGLSSESSVILGSTFGSGSLPQLQVSDAEDGLTLNGLTLRWEDQVGSGDRAFDDLVVNLQLTDQAQPIGASLQGQPQGEVLDLRSVIGSTTATITVNREAAFDNFLGFYPVLDRNGGIDTNGDGVADVLPNEANYAVTALQQRIAGVDLSTANQTTTTFSRSLPGGSVLAPFLIDNGTPAQLLDADMSNDPSIYFPFLAANLSQIDHVRLLGDNAFGFEDLPKSGDFDYNDLVIQVALG